LENETLKELENELQEKGYSKKTAKKIIKWYAQA
jgi:predicted Ser/Thr protein kinase